MKESGQTEAEVMHQALYALTLFKEANSRGSSVIEQSPEGISTVLSLGDKIDESLEEAVYG